MSQQELERTDQEVMDLVNSEATPEALASAEEIKRRVREIEAGSDGSAADGKENTEKPNRGATIPPSFSCENATSLYKGERPDRRQWRKQGGERVAGIGGRRSRADGKENTGDPNRRLQESEDAYIRRQRRKQMLSTVISVVLCAFISGLLVVTLFVPEVINGVAYAGIVVCCTVAGIRIDRQIRRGKWW